MSYAIYLRKSRADAEAEAHGEGETLLRHENALKALAEKFEFEIAEIYREIISGETIASRPEMQRLLSAVERGEYDGVLVMDADRLARGDSVDQGLVARAFRLTGTKIITPRKIYDPTSEFDEEYFEFELFMARREYKLINRRIQRGRTASAAEGRYIGSSAPYGYDRVKIAGGKGYTLTPNKEAAAVKYIFEQYLSCGGAGEVAAKLESMGVPTKKGKPWSRTAVIGILKNPVYTGKIRWAYRKCVKRQRGGRIDVERTVNENCILAEGIHEPLIEEDLFEKVRKKMSANRKKPVSSSKALQNPFTGLLWCGICGGRMSRLGRNSHTGYDALKCSDKGCECVSAPLTVVETAAAETLEQWLSGYEVSVKSPGESAEKNYMDIIGGFREELSKIKVRREKICEFLERGIYTAELFAERAETAERREKEVLEKIKRLEERAENERCSYAARNLVLPRTAKLSEVYCRCENAEEKNGFLRAVLGRAEYAKTVPNHRGHIDNSSITLDVYPLIEVKQIM
ncbi:MAG: recombinase family protein [Ruminococcus sp.]|nr:recombinase family protein [Ruminococcus sp.]MCM1382631.1 recombinase family protein [Muribaculaceae bacterium]